MATVFGEGDLQTRLLGAVRQVMAVEDVTAGTAKDGFLVRFRGRLVIDSLEAYSRLEPAFAREDTTLLFRVEANRHVIAAAPGRITPRPSKPLPNIVLFILTS